MKISSKLASILQKIFVALLFALLIIVFLELAFIGKDITYSTRFTPSSSDQNHLRNETYITEAQVLIIFFSCIYVFALPLVTFTALTKPKKWFYASIFGYEILNVILILLNFYFLIGGSKYRNYMNQIYENINNQPDFCNGDSSICMIGTCVRVLSFQSAKSMAISFTVINCVLSICFSILAFIGNKKRKRGDQLELLM